MPAGRPETEGVRLDEAAMRRPDIDAAGSVPVRLADGQEWLFPRPRLVLVPVFEGGRLADVGGRYSFGADYDALRRACADAEGLGGQVMAFFAIAIDLLIRNYDLAPEQAGTLLSYEPDDAGNMAMWDAISAVASGSAPPLGGGPKAGAIGSA